MTVRVYLTGNVAVEDGDVLVTERRFPARQGRLAFAVLAWERARAVSMDELADVIWDGTPPDAWQTALRSLVSKLRTTLRERATIGQAFGCYQLRLPADAWVDVEACDAAVHEAEAALRDGATARATGWALVANAVARRPFLSGDEGTWVVGRRDHLRDVRVRALEVRGRAALVHGDPSGAVTDARTILDTDPYRESAHTLLMEAHLAAGERAHAVMAYEHLRTTLAEDLGVIPSPETEAVFRDVLAAQEGSGRAPSTRR